MKMSGFFLATTLLGEVGGRRDEPKAEQKIVLRSRVVHNNCLEGLFTQSQVLLSSIVRLRLSLRLRFVTSTISPITSCIATRYYCNLLRRSLFQDLR